MITRKDAAARLDGNSYGEEGSPELFEDMKKAGLVAVFGYSDDGVELRGAIEGEVGASTIRLNRDGLLENRCDDDDCPYEVEKIKKAATIQPMWCKETDSTWIAGKSTVLPWAYRTNIPHDTFSIIEEGKLFCRGIVFALADVPQPVGTPDRVRHKKRGLFYTVVTRNAGLQIVDDRPLREYEVVTVFSPDTGSYLVTPTVHVPALIPTEITRSARLQVSRDRAPRQGDPMTVYVGDDGFFWVRPTDEFEDGRFVSV